MNDWHGTFEADLRSMGIPKWSLRQQFDPGSRTRIARYVKQLRSLEGELQKNPSALRRIKRAFVWRIHLRNAARLGFTIPPGCFGPGLDIAHYGTIVVNAGAKIGPNCRIHPGTLIGRSNGECPQIGADVYIGNGAKIYGGISIGDAAVIAPNSVVTHDVAANTIVGGIPARVLKSDVPYEWRD